MSLEKKLDRIYRTFWASFLTRCKAVHLNVIPNDSPFEFIKTNEIISSEETVSKRGRRIVKEESEDIIQMRLTQPIHMKDWPYKACSDKERVDILIEANETFYILTGAIRTSGTFVNYFKTEEKGLIAIPIESIHYDLERFQQEAHPIFHAQLADNIINAESRAKSDTFKKFTLKSETIKPRYGNVRIPTAHMDLISVLISLIADHSGASTLKDMIKIIKKETDFPVYDCKHLYTSIKGDALYFRSLHWYQENFK
jgi:hypothetical protein